MRGDTDVTALDELSLWLQFCNAIEQAGRRVLRGPADLDEVSRAEGIRYLTRLVRAGCERYLEFSDPLHPAFFRLCHETLKVGMDNPDNRYLSCRIRGDLDYRISGNRGTVHYVSLSAAADGFAEGGSQITTGFIDNDGLLTDADGNFEIHVGPNPPGHDNWLRTEPRTNTVMIRQTFLRRRDETEATFRIERLTPLDKGSNLTRKDVSDGLTQAASFVAQTGGLFLDWALSFLDHVNQLPPADQEYIASVGGDPNIFYYLSAWSLQTGEALLIHLPEIPPCEMWGFQLANFWLESLDYVNHQIHVNNETAVPNSDGSITIVVSNEDPGHANWLDCCGHTVGTMGFRWIKTTKVVHPLAELVRLDAVDWATRLKRWKTR